MKPRTALTAAARHLLRQREAAGLRWMIAAYVVFALAVMPGVVFLSPTDFERILSMALIAGILGGMVLGYLLLRKGKAVEAVGYGMVVLSWILMNLLPQIWFSSVGGGGQWPHSYFLKTTFTSIGIIFIALSGLSLQPRYPLALSLGLLGTWAFYIVQALQDSRVQWSANYVDGIFGPAVDITLLVWQTIGFAAAGLLVSLAASRARATLRDGVALEAANGQLSRYFSPNLVERLQAAEADFFKPGGRVQPVAVLFADIRDFTTLTETMEPDQVLRMLSAYHEAMSDAIFEHGGTLDKFMGDGIMATFGTPEPMDDDADRAVRAAMAMKQRLLALNALRISAGQPALGQGIGIHWGPVLAGNIGTERRLEYTVLGDTVNLASRLEGLCKESGRGLLVSDALRRRLKDPSGFVPLGSFRVKGRHDEVEVWALPQPTDRERNGHGQTGQT